MSLAGPASYTRRAPSLRSVAVIVTVAVAIGIVPVMVAVAVVQRVVQTACRGADQRAVADRKAGDDRTGDDAAGRADPDASQNMFRTLGRGRGGQRQRCGSGCNQHALHGFLLFPSHRGRGSGTTRRPLHGLAIGIPRIIVIIPVLAEPAVISA